MSNLKTPHPRVTRGQSLPKGAIKVSREAKQNLEALARVRKELNELNKQAGELRKLILAEAGSEESAVLVHNNKVVGKVSVETSMSVSKARLLEFRPDVFEELALPSKRVELDTK